MLCLTKHVKAADCIICHMPLFDIHLPIYLIPVLTSYLRVSKFKEYISMRYLWNTREKSIYFNIVSSEN